MDVRRDQGKPPVEVEIPSRPRKRGGHRKPWRLEYKTGAAFRLWTGDDWRRSGRYRREGDAREAYGTQVKKERRRRPDLRWSYRLIDPDDKVAESYEPEPEE